MFKYIYDPTSRKRHSVSSKRGRAILKKYLRKINKLVGGAAPVAPVAHVAPFPGCANIFNPDDLIGNVRLFGSPDAPELRHAVAQFLDGEQMEAWLGRMARMREEVTTSKATLAGSRKIAWEAFREPTALEIIGRQTIQDMEGHTEKWEQMIYQIADRAKLLLSKNPLLKIHTNFGQVDGIWSGETPSAIDLEIIPVMEEDGTHSHPPRDMTKCLEDTGYSPEQIENMEEVAAPKTPDGTIECYGVVNKKSEFLGGTSRRALRRGGDTKDVIVIKVGLPGHFTIALYYPASNLVEFFDSGGADATSPETLSILRPREDGARVETVGTETGRQTLCLTENLLHRCVCESFAKLFPGCKVVPVNTKDLQLSGKDAHCQTWVWLFIYLKFVWFPCQPENRGQTYVPTEDVINYFLKVKERGGEEALYQLIDNFWNYIIYYRPS